MSEEAFVPSTPPSKKSFGIPKLNLPSSNDDSFSSAGSTGSSDSVPATNFSSAANASTGAGANNYLSASSSNSNNNNSNNNFQAPIATPRKPKFSETAVEFDVQAAISLFKKTLQSLS